MSKIVYDGKNLTIPTDSKKGKVVADTVFQILSMWYAEGDEELSSLLIMHDAIQAGSKMCMSLNFTTEEG